MHEHLIPKIKKYVFFVSMIFSLFLGVHILYLYLYEGAIETPVEGGTISEGIIGTFPHFNPLVASNDHNKYINRLLYRSLLEYDIQQKKFVSDIASCDTSNLLYIECFLENNISWSNGQAITPDDIIATFNIIKKTEVNPSIAALLQETTLEKGEGKVIFTNSKKDINFLNIFLQPILPQSVIDSLTSDALTGNFSPVGGIYSGRFILASVNQDDTVGITKITLEKNPKYFKNSMYIEKIIFKLFTDTTHFLKHKSTINVFNDKDNIVGESVPRLNSVFYSLPQFVSIFLNQERVSNKNIRSFILDSISRDTIEDTLGNEKIQKTLNPYFSQKNIDIKAAKGLPEMMKSKGYYTKKELLESVKTQIVVEEKKTPLISEEAPVEKIDGKKQEDLVTIISPSSKKYNFVSEDNILLKGRAPEDIEAVYINDYKLQGYKQGDSTFYYRLAQSYDTMKLGENTYKIYFEKSGRKEFQEEVVYIYDTDSIALVEKEKDYFASEIVQTETPKKEEEEKSTNSIETSLSIEDVEALDSQFYYTAKGEVFRFILAYNNSDPLIAETAQTVQKELQKTGIFVELKALSLDDIKTGIPNDSIIYDGLLIGIDLGYFDSNLYPYLHSSQVKNGYNFSNYKQLGLDILLEELKSNNLSVSKKEEIQEKILTLLAKEPLLKVLYRPKVRLLIDKSINNYSLPASIPDSLHRFDPLVESYLTQKKNIQLQDKGIGDYLRFIFTSLF